MGDAETAKEFVKRWARLTDHLHTCQAAVMADLAAEQGAKHQAQVMFAERLGTADERRLIALQLALATAKPQ